MKPVHDERPWEIRQAVAVFVVWLGVSALAVAAVGPDVTAVEAYVVVVPVQTAALLGAVAWMARSSPGRRRSLGLRYGRGDAMGLVWGVLAQLGVAVAMLAISELVFHGDPPTQSVVDLAAELDGPAVALVVLGAVVLAPVAEELFFRGVLLRALEARWGGTVALYVSAVAFGLVHALEDPSAWLAAPILFVVGLILGRQALSTGRLAMPMLTHAAFNGLSIAALYLAS